MKPDPSRLDAGEMKTHTYGSLYSINHAFQEIAGHLKQLEDRRAILPRFAESQRIALEEARAGINRAVMDSMISSELDDWAYFGKLKLARERADEEEGPRPVSHS